MIYLYSFLFAGAICLIAEVILDNTKLTPGHITAIFVILGALLDICNIYDKIALKVGGAANIVIISFGHLLSHAAMIGSEQAGFMGIFTNIFALTGAGISSVIVISLILGLFFKPRN